MKFGIFDHVDRSDLPLVELFDKRIEYAVAAEKAGFYCYHVAEHHGTPLNMVPAPGVFLGAVAHATSRIRLGPLVYPLPLYSPLRLIEEIAMLDHLSNGRLELGVGRGVSPFELNFHRVDSNTSREIFLDALEVLTYGLSHDTLEHTGPHFEYHGVPMELRPLQQPHPPLWYPTSSPASASWSGANGYNFSTLGSTEEAKKCIDNYKEAFSGRCGPSGPATPFPGGTAIGVNRHVVVAETDAHALDIAGPAYARWYASITKLWRENQSAEIPAALRARRDIGTALGNGAAIAGSPETVRAEIARQIGILGVNYMILQFYFGNLSHKDAMRSLALFASEVLPKVKELDGAAKKRASPAAEGLDCGT